MGTRPATSSSFSVEEDQVAADHSSLVPTGHNEDIRGIVHEQSERRRSAWTAEKSVHPSDLDTELEAFRPLSKCETKCDKTYYRCPFKKRFNCAMVIRTIREVVTGHIVIESRGLNHSHNDSEEQFKRGLSNAVKEAIVEITKYNDRIRPQALQRALITVPFKFSMDDVKIEKVTSYLHRLRQTKTSFYIEHSVSGLWNAIGSRQFDKDSSEWAQYYFTITPDQAIVDAGTTDARVQIYATTRSLLENIRQISLSAGAMQVVLDSKHRVLMNNYPVTVLGVLDAGQQFNLVALAVSNKEDEEFYTSFVRSIQTEVQALGINWEVACTMSDNCDAIQNAFQSCFPQSLRGNCNFHIQQNIKKKRGLWQITVPSTIPASQKRAFVQRARNERERFTQDSIRWLSSLQSLDDFTLAGKLFLEILRAQGDQVFYDALCKEYFQGCKRGWARSCTTPGSATTNNALESFNGNVLAREIAAGSRLTIALLFDKLEAVFRSESDLSKARQAPNSSIDVRPCVRAKSHMKSRVQDLYVKALDLCSRMEESFQDFYQSDGNGGFFVLSSNSMRNDVTIETVLARQDEMNLRYEMSSAAARTIRDECIAGGVVTEEADWERILSTFKNLREAIELRGTSFYHVRFVPPNQNTALICAQGEAQRLASDVTADPLQRTKAAEALSSGQFLWFGALSHACSCSYFWNYDACKHALWATMTTTGEGPPLHVDPRPLATRRRGGRPRGVGQALHVLNNAQNPLI
jgi:hypothetical protein